MKQRVTKQQRENALYALNVMMPGIKPETVDLATWGCSQPCGTLACFGGHCTLDPYFQKQGLMPFSPLNLEPYLETPEGNEYGMSVGEYLFGDEEIFSFRNRRETNFPGADHELVLHRLRELIENTEVAE